MKNIFTRTITIILNLFLFLNIQAQTPIISTVAGGGTQTPGAGVLADSAFISSPEGVAVDAAGNIYIASSNLNSVLKADATTGILTYFAGSPNGGFSGDGGLADTAELDEPTGVAVDDSGNVYIADFGNDRIRKVTVSTGIITTVAGNSIPGYKGDNGPADSAELNGPAAVAIDDSGNIYIADRQNNRIRKVSAATHIITTLAGSDSANVDGGLSGDNGPADSAQLAQPNGVAVDGSGNVYIADYSNNRIRKVSQGIITTFAGSGPGGSTGTYSGDGGLADTAGLYYPTGVAADASGNVYITDSQNSRIRKVSNGIITTFAGNGTTGFKGDGGPADSAEISGGDNSVAVDVAGNIYIGDGFNVRVRKVTINPTAINDIAANDGITVYPNPGTGSITVALNRSNYYAAQIFDAQGGIIYTQELNTALPYQSLHINLRDAAAGIYLLRITGANLVTIKTIVIER